MRITERQRSTKLVMLLPAGSHKRPAITRHSMHYRE
jgi:hypothetical protein